MRQSEIFTHTLREPPKDEESVNAKLLIRAGFVQKLMAGAYSYLPFGIRVLKKIENIIREEMNRISGQEVFLPSLHPKRVWQKTGRWQYEEMFKLKNRSGKEYSLGWTHEEVVVPLVQSFVQSYRDLPVYVYQIQNKFRDELRAKSGLLRGVEFLMKDLYSFHKNEEELDEFYLKVKEAYFKIFDRCGIKDRTIFTFASGGSFSKFSHEFQTITPAGEDIIYLCPKCNIAINEEIIEELEHKCPDCGNQDLETKKSIEVGNIFKLYDKYTKPFEFTFQDEKGEERTVLMGCYGIGLGRLMGSIVEVFHDDQGIVWPSEVAPFHIHLLPIGEGKVQKKAEQLYNELRELGWEVLFDDREDKSAGEKFADHDLIGIPLRMVVSDKTLKKEAVEIKKRDKGELDLIKINNLKESLQHYDF